VGQRRVFYFSDTGQPAYRHYDLFAADFLDAQPGDEFFHGELHDNTARQLAHMLYHHYRYSPTTSVQFQPKLLWPDPSLAQPMPDVVVINNLYEPQRQRPILDLAAEGSAPDLASDVGVRALFEVTSPALAELDLDTKRTLYSRAGVAEYWVIDTGLRPQLSQPSFTILGYTLQGDSYQPIPPIASPTASSRWESKACRLWLEVADNGQSIRIGDLRTGKPLPLPTGEEDPFISAEAEANRRAQSIAGQLKL
jgi:Uma2 family endonuclease